MLFRVNKSTIFHKRGAQFPEAIYLAENKNLLSLELVIDTLTNLANENYKNFY